MVYSHDSCIALYMFSYDTDVDVLLFFIKIYQWLCLVTLKSVLCKKKRFPVTSNLRYMHRVLNVDKIKN
jgi:hypothetical protein